MTPYAEAGGALFTATAVTYAGSLAHYIASMASPREWLARAASVLRLVALAFHTVYLGARYYHSAMVEIAEREKVGIVLTGIDRLWVAVSHPPYTNLYESLMFITWTLMVAYAVIEWKWKLRPMGVIAVGITLAGLVEAYIVVEKAVRPLVPALQSWWILIHVGIIFLSYALFMLAAVVGVLYLMRSKVPTATMGAVHTGGMAVVALLAGGIKALLTHAAFEVTPLALQTTASGEQRWTSLHVFPMGAQKAVRFWVEVPGVGPMVLLSIALLVAASVAWWLDRKSNTERGWGLKITVAGTLALTASLGLLVYRLSTTAPFAPDIGTASLPMGVDEKVILSIGQNFNLGLLVLVWASLVTFVAMALWRKRLEAQLPSMKKLDDITYKVIIVGFPMLTIGIVMGALWAFDAWGRYWGWDPKETWSLITWAIYATYLHVRITHGPGKTAAAIAVFGFGVVVFTYMGVNLGLTGEGLHVYGAG